VTPARLGALGRGARAVALVAALGLPPALAQVPEPGHPAAPAAHPDNVYRAGPEVKIDVPAPGDVHVAGRKVRIAAPVGGDILAAGWDVEVTAPAEDDVRVVGGTLRLDATITGDLTAAGGDVSLGAATHLLGRGWVTGDTVRVDGAIDRDLHIAARVVQVGGEIRGPLDVVAEEFEVLPGAKTYAAIRYRGRAPARVAPDAALAQPIAFERVDAEEARRARAWPGVSTVIFSLHLLALGLLLLYLVPRFEPSTVSTLRQHPAKSALFGFVLLAAAPAVAVALVLSVLGLPLGLALGMSYVMALFVAVLVTAFFIGDVEARLVKAAPITTRRQQALWLLAGVVTLALLRALVGGVVLFLATLFGLGALSLAAYEAFRRPAAPPATAPA
jgi:hypothetical protein